jgi:hypothetical protein
MCPPRRHQHEEGRVDHRLVGHQQPALAQIVQGQRGQHQTQPSPGDRRTAEVAHVGVERLGAGHRQHDGRQGEEGDVQVVGHEFQCVQR